MVFLVILAVLILFGSIVMSFMDKTVGPEGRDEEGKVIYPGGDSSVGKSVVASILKSLF